MSDRAIVRLENELCAGKLPEFVCAECPVRHTRILYFCALFLSAHCLDVPVLGGGLWAQCRNQRQRNHESDRQGDRCAMA